MVDRPMTRIIPPKKLHPSNVLLLPDTDMGLFVDDEVLLEAAGVIVVVLFFFPVPPTMCGKNCSGVHNNLETEIKSVIGFACLKYISHLN